MTTFAGLVILAAAVSGVFQLAVLALPSYREELSNWITRVAGRPVDIGSINLVWRGIYPRLDLQGITLYDEDEQKALTADRISLGFSSLRLLTGELMPTRIELSGLNLAADVDEEGRLSVAGFETGGDHDFPRRDRLLKELRRFQLVRLSNCEVRFTHAGLGRTPMEFTLVSGEIDRTRSGFEAEAELRLPPAFGEGVEMNASIEGDVADPRSWDGDFDLVLRRAELQAWAGRWMLPGTQLRTTELDVEIAGALRSGRLARAQAQLQADALVVARGGRAHQASNIELETTLSADGAGWRLELDHFEQDGQPQLRGGLRYERQAEGYQLDADLDELQLDRLAPWLGYLRSASPGLRRAASLRGRIDGSVLRLQRGADSLRYSLRADLQQLALAGDPAVGFRGFSGELSATEGGGRLEIKEGPLELQLPQILSAPLPFDQVGGELRWNRSAEGWTLQASELDWKLARARGNGRLQLQLPADDGVSPRLDLDMDLAAEDVTALKPWMPQRWGDDLQQWLGRAVERGRVPRGTLAIHGPLADFPFHRRKTGEWKLDLDVAGGRLAFSPEWPAVDQLAAHLAFRGNSLHIVSESASLSGNKVDKVVADIADFHDSVLVIDGQISGETARFYDFLRQSPLRQRLSVLVNRTRASGPAAVDLHLDIPLHKIKDTTVSGDIALNGVQLFYDNLDIPVDDIRGNLHFTDHGVEAERIDARFSDVDLAARIEARPRTAGVIVAEFDYAPQPDGDGVSGFIPGLVRSRLSGAAHWRAELPMDAPDAALTLFSDLRGTAVALPPPLGKAAAETSLMRLTLGSDAAAPLRVKLDYGQRLGADIALAREAQVLKVRTLNLRLGGGMPVPTEARGITVSGELPELDLGLWAALLGSDKGEDGLPLREAELSAARWLWEDKIIGPSRMRWTPTPEGWRTELKGEGAEGELRYSQAAGGVVTARMGHLRLLARPANAPAAVPSLETTARDPNRWPLFDVDVEQLEADGTTLGRLQLRSARIPEGQRIETFSIGGGKLDLSAGGNWRRSGGRSSADLKFELGSSDIGSVLKSLGYTPTISARASKFTGELSWPPAPQLDWQRAAGRIRLEVDSGTLKAVEPGAGGRVLGLLNLYAIPRRLLLDFRDVVSSGLGFDKVTGSFTLGEGHARTEDMEIRSPSVRMEMRGRVGLVARDFDQVVKVYPDVSSGVTLGAALLGGPAVGALVLLAQQVLDKPIEQVTQLSYRVTGSWDNPRVERGSGH
ncbi:MAG TPA: YhdP family protein [Solimonas sp.]|nr:YhdP family protein [Solimonas sp.]